MIFGHGMYLSSPKKKKFFFLFDITLIPFSFQKVVQSTFRMEEMYHSVSQQLDEEKK